MNIKDLKPLQFFKMTDGIREKLGTAIYPGSYIVMKERKVGGATILWAINRQAWMIYRFMMGNNAYARDKVHIDRENDFHFGKQHREDLMRLIFLGTIRNLRGVPEEISFED